MPRWAPCLFSTGLLLLLGAVLGHAAEHDGWFKGLFHCHAVEVCHGDADAVPCDGAACHSHDEVAQDIALPSLAAPVVDLARTFPDFQVVDLIPALCLSCSNSRLPDPPPPLRGLATWTAGWFPLLT